MRIRKIVAGTAILGGMFAAAVPAVVSAAPAVAAVTASATHPAPDTHYWE